jgi:hypothetical protein
LATFRILSRHEAGFFTGEDACGSIVPAVELWSGPVSMPMKFTASLFD